MAIPEQGVAPATLAQGLRQELRAIRDLVTVSAVGVLEFNADDRTQKLDRIIPKMTRDDLIVSPDIARLSLLAMYKYDDKMQMQWRHWLYAYYYNRKSNRVYLVDPNAPYCTQTAQVVYQPTKDKKQYLRLLFDPGPSPSSGGLAKDAVILVPFMVTVDLKPELLRRVGQ